MFVDIVCRESDVLDSVHHSTSQTMGRPTCLSAAPDKVLLTDSQRVIHTLMAHENQYLVRNDYCETLQTCIQPYMRKILATWMLEVCEEQRCEDPVFPLAMSCLDRLLSHMVVQKSQLQILGSVCLLLASKCRQWRALSPEHLSYYTDHSVSSEDLKGWELLVLGRLGWDLGSVLAHDYVDYLLAALADSANRPNASEQQQSVLNRARQHAITLLTLCSTEYEFMKFHPSLLACGGVLSAIQGLQSQANMDEVASVFHKLTGHSMESITMCCMEIESLVTSNAENLQPSINQSLAGGNGCSMTTSSSSTGVGGKHDTSSGGSAPETPTDVQDVLF